MGLFYSKEFEKLKNIDINGAKEKIVVLLGLTGAGKSSLINGIVGRQECEIGHKTESCTKKLKIVNYLKDGINYYLVDTPGFDDSKLTEEEIISKLNELRNYPRICTILICLRYNETKLSNTVTNVLKHIMDIFPAKDFWEHAIIIRTWCQMDDEDLQYHKETYGGELLKGIKDNQDLIKFMNEKGINLPLNLDEFYVDSSPRKIKQRTQEEYLKVLTKIRRLLPIYKNAVTKIREETLVTIDGEITFVKFITYKDYTFTDFNDSVKKISNKIREEEYNLNSIKPSLIEVKRIQGDEPTECCPWFSNEHQFDTHYIAIKIYDLDHKQYRKEYEIECRNEYKNDQADEAGEKYRELLLEGLKNISNGAGGSGKHSVNEEK